MSRTEALQFVNLAHFFDHFFLLIFPTAALAIAPAWGMRYAEVLLLGSPAYILFALGTPLSGWLGDAFDRLNLIGVFFLGCGMSSICVGLSSSTLAMMIWLGVLGLFASLYHPVGLALVTQIGMRTGRALAINGVFGNMGLAGATAVTGVLATQFGWQAAFLAPGAVSVLIGATLFLRQNRLEVRDVSNRDVASVATSRAGPRCQISVFVIVCVSALFGGLIFNSVTIALPKFFDERLIAAGGDLGWIGASAGFVFAVAAFAQLPVGELLDRIGARPILLTLLGAQVICLLLLTQATGVSAFVLCLLLVTCVFAEIPITTWLLGQYIDPGLRSRAVSVEYTLSLGVGSMVVPLIAFVQGRGVGLDGLFAGLAAAALCIMAAAVFLPKNPAHKV